MSTTPVGRWTAILFLSFLVFWPAYGCLRDAMDLDSGSGRYGYGRRSDLAQIGKAIEFYAGDHRGQYPPTLAALYPTYVDRMRLLVSPGDIDGADSSLQRYHYLAAGADESSLQPDAPVVVYPYRSGDTVLFTVLHADGHILVYDAARFREETANRAKGGRRE